MTLNKMLLSATAAAALALTLGGAASAGSVGLGTIDPTGQSFYVTGGDVLTGPEVTAAFGDTFSTSGAFSDTFNFGSYFAATGSGSVSTTFTSKSDSLTIDSVTIDGGSPADTKTYTMGEWTVPGEIQVPIIADTYDSITITGTTTLSKNGLATYDGTAVLTAVSAAPEPAAWLLMIGGIALTGAALRRRQTATVQFA